MDGLWECVGVCVGCGWVVGDEGMCVGCGWVVGDEGMCVGCG